MALSLNDLANLSVSSDSGNMPDAVGVVRAIFKVRKPGYVPEGVQVRARIDDEMFTGSVRATRLKALDKDKNVVSVSPAEPLQIIK